MNFCLPLVVLIVLYNGSSTAISYDDIHEIEEAIAKTAMIDLLTHRTPVQRLTIAEEFEILDRRELKEWLSVVFREDDKTVKSAVVALVTSSLEYRANELHEATRGPNIDQNALIEILVPLKNSEVRELKWEYRELFDNELEDDIRSVTEGDFQKLLVSLCSAGRNEEYTPRPYWDRSSEQLKHIEKGHWSSNGILNTILTTMNFRRILEEFDQFIPFIGRTVEQLIKEEFDKWTAEGYLAIVELARKKSEYFAERLHEAMSGESVRNSSLTRIVLGNSVDELSYIKFTYQRLYGQPLLEDIKNKTTGYHEYLLKNILEP